MFITPMQPIGSIEELNKVTREQSTEQSGAAGFQDVLKEAVNNVVQTDDELTKQQYLLSTGQIEDAHTVPIAAAQAQLSVDMLVQLRNKALESYNELIRLNI